MRDARIKRYVRCVLTPNFSNLTKKSAFLTALAFTSRIKHHGLVNSVRKAVSTLFIILLIYDKLGSNCDSETGKCKTCKKEFTLTPINTCIECAETKKYISQDGRCLDCSLSSHCKRCDKKPPHECSACFEGFLLIDSKCLKIKEPIKELKLTKKSFNEKERQIELIFPVKINQTILKENNTKSFKIEIETGEKNKTRREQIQVRNFSIKAEKNFASTLIFKLEKLPGSVIKGTAVITLPNPNILNETNNELNQFQEGTIRIYPVDILSSVDKGIKGSADKVSKAFSIIALLISIISIKYAMQMNKIYQMFGYLLLLNIPRPTAVQAFLSAFNHGNVLSFIPNIRDKFSNEHCSELGKRFIDEDLRCQILGNIGNMVLLLVLILIFRFILEVAGSG